MKKILSTMLAAAMVMTAAVSVSAITMSETPITGGTTLFTQAEMMYTGEPEAASSWSNAFCNEEWTGAQWTAETVDGVDCIKIVPVEGREQCFLDFNYYQWNNDMYYPSLDCSEYSFIKIRYMLNDAGAAALGVGHFWASEDAAELSTTEDDSHLDFTMPDATPNEWQEVIVDLSDMVFGDNLWGDTTIRQFRVYPFGWSMPGTDAACYIEYIAFFATKEEAEAFSLNAPVEETPAETEAPAEVVETVAADVAETVTTAPVTFDAGIIAAVAAIVSAAGYAISKKH